MGNLRKHAKICFGEETVEAADTCKNLAVAREVLNTPGLKNQSITAMFEQIGKGKVTYLHVQHMNAERQ